jgi:transcription antitermination protein NusB
MGSRRKARESALQMLFAADVVSGSGGAARAVRPDELVGNYWSELGEAELDESAREFATRLVTGALAHLPEIDERIRSRAEHWRISRMAVVDRNVLRLAVYEFLYEPTPRTVAINEALEVARRFSTYEATQFINGILDAIKRDLDRERPQPDSASEGEDEDDDGPSPAARHEDDDEDDTEHAPAADALFEDAANHSRDDAEDDTEDDEDRGKRASAS